MLFGHWFQRHAISSIRFRSGACADGTIGAELAHIMLMRGSTRRFGTPLGPFAGVCPSLWLHLTT